MTQALLKIVYTSHITDIISGMQEDMMALLDEVLPSGVPRTSDEQIIE